MKRKIIKQGNGSYIFTLPIDWIRENNLQAGDEIVASQRDKALVLRHDGGKTDKVVEIKINTPNLNLIKHRILSSYLSGAAEVNLHLNFNTLKDRNNKQVDINQFVREYANSLHSFSVVEQKDNHFKIIEVSASSNNGFDSMLQQAFNSLLLMGEQSLEALKEGNKKEIEDLDFKRRDVKRFTDYCIRLLNKMEYKEHKKTASIYLIVKCIEKIAETYKHIAIHFKNNNDKNIIQLHEDINSMIRLNIAVYNKFDEKKVEEYFGIRDRIYVNIYKAGSRKTDSGLLENIEQLRRLSTSLMNELMVVQ
ncbi:MAG: AbrB/MazE/SpoVT family DNA-binding domain-containing protein [Nanoarchaeota archaeon]|nr:AbrB/MazE/SpoVT family DNA-binding domain-containing protein [Nanoarchaeota archaeon]